MRDLKKSKMKITCPIYLCLFAHLPNKILLGTQNVTGTVPGTEDLMEMVPVMSIIKKTKG